MMENIFYQIFKGDYNRKSFQDNVLIPIFQNSAKDFVLYDQAGEQQIELTDTDRRTAKQVVKYGEFTTSDNRKVELYEAVLEDFKQVKIARVGLGALVKKLIIGNNAVFATFRYEDATDKHWRFSFIAYDSFFEDGQVHTEETNPKRYTYVFGDRYETYRTAIDRFSELYNSHTISVKDIKEAFAVEAMSKEFFDEYRETHYANFVKYLTGEEFQKKGNKYELVKVQDASPFLASVFNGETKDARDFCKKLLGQIVFLYFLQKKGWMGSPSGDYKKADGDRNFLQNFYNQARAGDAFYPVWLSKLFYETLNKERDNDDFTMPDGTIVKIPYLNGGLFDKDSDRYDYLTFPHELFTELFEFFNRYNFTIYENSPEEHTVAVDPEMLGHIFENLLEDNKDKGAFYTPKEIVHYMCQESLIEYLTTHLSQTFTVYKQLGDNQIELFGQEVQTGQLSMLETVGDKALDKTEVENIVKNKDISNLTKDQLREIERLLDSVKICDPAIGSGAFPMGLLQEIFALKERIAFDLGYKIWSPATVKENIIQNSIYGVDIEKGAVDIAQLRFWLSLIVDEETPKPLPNLAYKIVTGNSLISKFEDTVIEIDWDKTSSVGEADKHIKAMQKALHDISDKQKKFFDTKNHDNKLALKAEIRNLKLDVLIAQLLFNKAAYLNKNQKVQDMGLGLTPKDHKCNLEIDMQIADFNNTLAKLQTLKTNNKPFNHFDWTLDFPEVLNPYIVENPNQRGFDIVIGNPPYIKEYTKREAFNGFRESLYYQGKMDLWYGFACYGIDLLKQNGNECFIAQNNWITSAGASILRNKVLKETEIKLFTDFWNYKVFKSAGIQTMIFLLKKKLPAKQYKLRYSLLNDDSIKESELSYFLDFNNHQINSNKYELNFASDTYIDNLITFNNPTKEKILDTLLNHNVCFLNDNEVANGIHPHFDFIDKKILEKLDNSFKIGDGIFGLSKIEIDNLSLNDNEKKLIKRYYPDTKYFWKYFGKKVDDRFIIYTDSSFKNIHSMDLYPNLKKHLDKFQNIITSDNKPYGLHRARKEDFFIGEKIAVQRKCANNPVFTYLDFDSYISATFYIIKTNRFNLKYLTALLNSKLIAFWLRYKGKMQGNNYQIDKEPLVHIPILQPNNIEPFTMFTDFFIYLYNSENSSIFSHTLNTRIASHFEDILDMMVYELYFGEHMKAVGIDVLQFIAPKLAELKNLTIQEQIKQLYEWYQQSENPVCQRIMLIDTRSPDILAVIRKSVN